MGELASGHLLEMTKRTFFTAALLGAIVACGGNVTSLGGVGDGTEPITNNDGTSSAKPEEPTGTSEDDAANAIDGGPADAGGGGSGKVCNPFVASPASACPAGEYCQADVPGTCGIGKCVTNPPPPPPFCPSMECGCDGKLRCAYGSRSNGVDVGSTQCGFTCGNTTCNGLTEYCEHAAGGAMLPDGGGAEWWTCKPIPAACDANRSCACVLQAIGAGGGGGYVCESEKDQKVTIAAMLP